MPDLFDEPRLAINRVYTKRGDAGETSLAGGQRRPKDDLRVEAYGAVDELDASLGKDITSNPVTKTQRAYLLAFADARLKQKMDEHAVVNPK